MTRKTLALNCVLLCVLMIQSLHVQLRHINTRIFFILSALQNWFVRVCICGLWVQTVSQQSTSVDSANREMFICKATCTIQLILLRMSHPQATYSTFKVGFG